jgi:hypothetical protein
MKDRLTAATPGPWNVDRNYPFTSDLVGIFAPNAEKYVLQVENQDDVDDPTSVSDAAFIAHSPTDQAKLIAAIEAVVTEIAHTDLESYDALQGDLADRVLAALTQALGGDTA